MSGYRVRYIKLYYYRSVRHVLHHPPPPPDPLLFNVENNRGSGRCKIISFLRTPGRRKATLKLGGRGETHGLGGPTVRSLMLSSSTAINSLD